jgi:hypothetical protein
MAMQINDDVEETGQRRGCRDMLSGRLGTLPEWRRQGLGALQGLITPLIGFTRGNLGDDFTE